MTPQGRKPFHVLVPVDFSAASDLALRYLVQIGQHLRCGIHLLHVQRSRAAHPERRAQRLARFAGSPAGICMRACLERLEGAGLTEVRGRLETGPPDEVIADVAREGYALVVLGLRQRGFIERVIDPSVAAKLIHQAPCPVLVLRPGMNPLEGNLAGLLGAANPGRGDRTRRAMRTTGGYQELNLVAS